MRKNSLILLIGLLIAACRQKSELQTQQASPTKAIGAVNQAFRFPYSIAPRHVQPRQYIVAYL